MAEETFKELVKGTFFTKTGEKYMEAWRQSVGVRPSYFPGNTPEETAFCEGERSAYQNVANIIEEIKRG